MRHLTIVVVLVLGCPACADPTPISVAPSDAGTVQRDSSVDGGFDLASCMSCLMDVDAGCGGIVNACMQDPTCDEAYECAMSTNCYGLTSAQFIQCGLPCANEAGLSLSSAGYSNAVAYFGCVTAGACGSKCIVP